MPLAVWEVGIAIRRAETSFWIFFLFPLPLPPFFAFIFLPPPPFFFACVVSNAPLIFDHVEMLEIMRMTNVERNSM